MKADATPTLKQAFTFARSKLKSHFGLLSACVLTFFGAWVLLEILVVAGQKLGIVWWSVAHVSFFFVFAGLQIGFLQICFRLYDDQPASYVDIFKNIKDGPIFFLVQLLFGVVMLFGLILLIIPGIYFRARYAFYGYFFAEERSSLQDIFRRSADISQDSMRLLFLLSITLMFLNVAGAGFLGIGLIVTVPLSTLMKTFIFRELPVKNH